MVFFRVICAVFLLAGVAVTACAQERLILLDGSRGFSPGGDFDAYRTMEIFMEDRGYRVLRSVEPLTDVDLSGIDVLFLSADWMADGPYSEAERGRIAAFVAGGGSLMALGEAPGTAAAAINQVTEPLGIPCGQSAVAAGKITVSDHPTVQNIRGLTFPDAGALAAAQGAEVLATDAGGTPVIVIHETGSSVVLVLGAPIWRTDLWTEGREQVLRQTLGWLAGELTPVERITWGGLKLGSR
jgi:hypothetical protein